MATCFQILTCTKLPMCLGMIAAEQLDKCQRTGMLHCSIPKVRAMEEQNLASVCIHTLTVVTLPRTVQARPSGAFGLYQEGRVGSQTTTKPGSVITGKEQLRSNKSTSTRPSPIMQDNSQCALTEYSTTSLVRCKL